MKSESPAVATPDCRIASAEPIVPVPFKIYVPQETLGAIRAKVRDYPWGYMPDDGGWGYGSNLGYMKEICRYWVDEYDWRLHEARLNEFSQAKVGVGGVDLHFVHERGSGPCPMPLLITHGWPGSIVEYAPRAVWRQRRRCVRRDRTVFARIRVLRSPTAPHGAACDGASSQ